MSTDGSAAKAVPQTQVTLTIDGNPVTVPLGTTIFDAARLSGIPIPTLCHQQNENPVGVCRVCVVEVVGARVYAASCIRQAESGMVVKTNTPPLDGVRRTLLELLMADHPSPCTRQQHSGDCELETLAAAAKIQHNPFPRRSTPRGHDNSSLSIIVDHEACILCDRCIRGCDYIQDHWVLARRGKGYQAGIAFDLNQPMADSGCVSCGECMVSCPTGALTNRKIIGTKLEGDPVDPEFLLGLPVFKKVSGTFLELNRNAVVERRIHPNEIICREGESGHTAFYILDGTVDVFISSPLAHVKTADDSTGLLSKLRSFLVPRERHSGDGHSTRTSIPIDASVDLPFDKRVAQLHAGELFGEMTCMSYYPRSATVRAVTEVRVLEMERNVLDILQRNKSFREQLDRTYKQRALESHLRSVPVLASLTPEFIERLKERVELVRYLPGQVICAQGDPADAFYLVRLGFVKVSESRPGGDLVLAYLARGSYFGEMAFLGNSTRTATCTAVDQVEVVRIPGEDFRAMLELFPDVRGQMEAVAAEHIAANRQRLKQIESVPVDQFLNQGLMEAQSLLILDLDRCTRCDQCVRACADAHDGVSRLIREGLRFDRYLVATSCRSCRDPLCMVGCPVGSIHRGTSMEIVIEDWCVGCGRCADNCPYGNINMHPFTFDAPDPEHPGRMMATTKPKATGCDLCRDHEEPSCVYACPHDAAHRVNPTAFFGGLLKQPAGAKEGM